MKPDLSTHAQELSFLASLGFATNPYNTGANTIEEVWDIARHLESERKNIPYGIDGMVVKVNNNQLVQSAGVVGKTPRAYCAIKFKAEEITSIVRSVTWQTGRTGRVTPVAEFDPVELAGTVVKRATLHNAKEIETRNLHIGDTIVIRKAGDIIPEVIQVLDNLRDPNSNPVPIPSTCPVCSSPLVRSQTHIDLMCVNTDSCPAQIIGRLTYYTSRSIGNITGISKKHITKFIHAFGIKDIPDLYDLPFDIISTMEGFGAKSVENLYQSIQRARSIDDYRFLAGLSIEGVGLEVARLICDALH